METYQLGFISSLMTGCSIIAESFLVGPALSIFRHNDYQSIITCLFLLSILYTVESACTSIQAFIMLALIPGSVVSTILSAASRSMFLQLIPSSHIGKVSGLFNAASTGIAVVAPIYGSQVFSMVIGDLIQPSPINHNSTNHHDFDSDPDALIALTRRKYTRGIALRQKGIITAIHYLVLFIICIVHYIWTSRVDNTTTPIIISSKKEMEKHVEEKKRESVYVMSSSSSMVSEDDITTNKDSNTIVDNDAKADNIDSTISDGTIIATEAIPSKDTGDRSSTIIIDNAMDTSIPSMNRRRKTTRRNNDSNAN